MERKWYEDFEDCYLTGDKRKINHNADHLSTDKGASEAGKKIIKSLFNINHSSPLINIRGKKLSLPMLDLEKVSNLLKEDDISFNVEGECSSTLDYIIRSSAKIAKSCGHNPACVVVGYASWKPLGEESLLRSPLVLIPVSIRKNGSRVTVSAQKNPATINQALLTLLEGKGIDVSFAAKGVTDLNRILSDMESLSASPMLQHFEVVKDIDIAVVDFRNAVMIKELESHTEDLVNHPVVSGLLGLKEYTPQIIDRSAYDEPCSSFTVFPADDYQAQAIGACSKGYSAVIQGPPGGGKSQTIVNSACKSLGEGKRVLIVSEKEDALKVVSQQLNTTPVGKYALELSSVKSTPQILLNRISDNCKTEDITEEESAQLRQKAEKCFRALEKYQTAIHSKENGLYKAGVSLYDMIGTVISDDYPLVGFKNLFPNPLIISDDFYEKLETEVKTIAAIISKIGDYGENTIWTGINTAGKSEDIATLISSLQDALSKADSLLQSIEVKCGISVPHTVNNAKAVCSLELGDPEAVTRFCTANGYTINSDGCDHSKVLNKKALTADMPKLQSALNVLADSYRKTVDPDGNISSMLEDAGISVTAAEELETLAESCDLSSAYINRLNKLCGTTFTDSVSSMRCINELLPCLYIKRAVLKDALHNADCFELRKHLNTLKTTSERFISLEAKLKGMLHPSAFEPKATEKLLKWNELMKTKYTNIAYLLPDERGEYAETVSRLDSYRIHPNAASSTHAEVKKLLETYSEYISLRNTRADAKKAIDAALYGDETAAYGEIDINKILHILDSEENRKRLERVVRFDIDPSAAGVGYYLNLKTLEGSYPVLRTNLMDKYGTQLIAAGGFETGRHITLSGIGAAAHSLSTIWRDICKIREVIVSYSNGGYSLKTVYNALLWLENTEDARSALSAAMDKAAAYSTLSVSDIQNRLRATLIAMDNTVSRIKGYFNSASSFSVNGDAELKVLQTEYLAQFDQIGLERYLEYTKALSSSDALTRGFFKRCVNECVDINTDYGLLFKRCLYSEILRLLGEDRSSPVSDLDEHSLQNTTAEYERLIEESHLLETSRVYGCINSDIKAKLAAENALYSAQIAKVNGMLAGTGTTLREVITAVPELFKLTVRCVLATPVEVVSFTPCNGTDFDVVIFDEASQVIPANAISSLLRAPQCIIVGDSKQLPPTTFFQRQATDDTLEVDDEEIYTGEVPRSILESASYILPTLSLDFHYRSKHESLIAFSNNHFYTVGGEDIGRMNTIPDVEPVHPSLGVDFVKCEAPDYKDGANPSEARLCVSLVEKYIESLENTPPSLMIVTFGVKHRKAVLAAIEEYKSTNTGKTASFFNAADLGELVKHLESAQGREADYIILSVGYCERKDNGKIKNTFGPLLSEAGPRRLNVALSRSRKKLTVVSSFEYSELEAGEHSENVNLLRELLYYAKYNRTQMPQARGNSGYGRDAFCNSIKSMLERNGYTCHLNAGRSNFNIDIAVVDPKNNNKYIAAILCDSKNGIATCKTYYSRYVKKDALLSARGWNVIRLWSGLWGKQPEYQKKLLLSTLEKLTNG